MPKERVVVFDGEDKFIAPRNVIYDKNKGEANAVGGEAPIQVVDEAQPKRLSPEGTAFEEYMRNQSRPVVMPSVGEDNFCQKMQTFIQTRGMGKATPEQLEQAYQLFQDNCRVKEEPPKEQPPKEEPPKEQPPAEQPRQKPADKRVPVELAPPTPPIKDIKVAPPAPPAAPPAPVVPVGFVPLSSPTLGMPLRGGGGEEAAPPAEKKGSNWLLWLLIGGTILYFATRKKG